MFPFPVPINHDRYAFATNACSLQKADKTQSYYAVELISAPTRSASLRAAAAAATHRTPSTAAAPAHHLHPCGRHQSGHVIGLKARALGLKARALELKARALGLKARALELKARALGLKARAFKLNARRFKSNARAFKSNISGARGRWQKLVRQPVPIERRSHNYDYATVPPAA